MKIVTRLALAIAVAVATLTATAGVASATPPDVSQCKNGGYASYVDQATGRPFVNQGRCVSVVARGDVLVPIVPPTTLSSWSFNVVPAAPWCRASATLSGAASTVMPLTWLVNGTVAATEDVTTTAGGTVTVGRVLTEGATVQLVVDDQTFDLPPINCGLVPVSLTSAHWPVTGPGCGMQLNFAGTPGTTHSFRVTVNPWFTNQGFVVAEDTFTLDSAGTATWYRDVNAGSGGQWYLWFDDTATYYSPLVTNCGR